MIFVSMSTVQMGIPKTLFDGTYPDFTEKWYQEVATFLVVPTILNIFLPILEFLFSYLTNFLIIWEDRGFSTNPNFTKTKTIGQYIEIWKGEEFSLSDNYSYITVLVLMNLLYGAGIPILFPLTLFAWISIYIFNKYSIFD